jgi:glycosyltransferase involved in cell wall biosynthesis
MALRINFILPSYVSTPIGGFRVIYEYADFLAARGHAVTIVFPRRQREGEQPVSWLEPLKRHLWGLKTRLNNRPLVAWHMLHPSIKIALVPVLTDAFIPDGDITVATMWTTAQPVAALSSAKGAKFYLIQHHEIWAGSAEEVNATWQLPLHKIVISKWLQALGEQLGATDMRHIPNGIDLNRFRVITPPQTRQLSILTLNHHEAFKGVPDALAALSQYHERFPNVPVSMFGTQPRGSDIPDWIKYFNNPSQDALVRDLYNQHAIYLSASLAEGWALPPAEAMACGCTFVGTDIGGFRDYSVNEDTALLSPPRDRDALLQNLVRVTESAELRARIQRQGTENIQQFTWAAAGSAMEEYFTEYASAQPEAVT